LSKRGKRSVAHHLWHLGDEHVMVPWASEQVQTTSVLSLLQHTDHLHLLTSTTVFL